ncbi:MAG: hypothetical protein ORN98_08490 [Alphaproteobacteria bacterium]|nr:hypothetical protein [Alphaproteobacteria bacterium]
MNVTNEPNYRCATIAEARALVRKIFDDMAKGAAEEARRAAWERE